MAERTDIEWTDATWQIVTGCDVLSPGCTNCYAMRLAGGRLRHHPSRGEKAVPAHDRCTPTGHAQEMPRGRGAEEIQQPSPGLNESPSSIGSYRMARIYVASSWRNARQPQIVEQLRYAGHQVYDFRNPPHSTGFSWRQIGLEVPCTAEDYRTALLTNPRAAQGFMADFAAMRWADVGLLALPCGRSAHLELGWMAGAGKRTLILTQDGEEPELMALLADQICVSMDEVLKELGA